MATGRSQAARFGIQFDLLVMLFIVRDATTLAEPTMRSMGISAHPDS